MSSSSKLPLYKHRSPRSSSSASTLSLEPRATLPKHDNNVHSIWSASATTTTTAGDPMAELLQNIFSDVLVTSNNKATTHELLQQLRSHIDQQALRIQELERKLDAQKRAVAAEQRQQFEALKQKYRTGLERIVDNWLKNETAEQEAWMQQVQQEADDRVAKVEAHWKQRVSRLQQELRQLQQK